MRANAVREEYREGRPVILEPIREIDREAISPDRIQEFLDYMKGQGRSISCIEGYQRALVGLYEELPESWRENPDETLEGAEFSPFLNGGKPNGQKEKWIDGTTGSWWLDWMYEQGFSSGTINTRLSAWNSFVKYLGRKEWCLGNISSEEKEIQPELSRREYLRLLSTAKQQGKERTYMLIKLMGGAGLRVQELPQLTAEAVRKGVVSFECHNGKQSRVLRLPSLLQEELKEYMNRQGIHSGPVFVSGTGRPLTRSTINASISLLSSDARVQAEKANPRCLRNMYEDVQKNIYSNISLLVDQAYEKMLEQEELSIGWK